MLVLFRFYCFLAPRCWFYLGFIAFLFKIAGFVNVFISFLSPDICFIKVLLLFGSQILVLLRFYCFFEPRYWFYQGFIALLLRILHVHFPINSLLKTIRNLLPRAPDPPGPFSLKILFKTIRN